MRPDQLYLRDILAATDAIGRFLVDVDRDRFTSDELIQSAVLQKLTVIGEAAARVSQGVKVAHPEIEWHLAVGLRNIVVHAYFSVDWSTIWQTAIEDVPPLALQLGPVLESLEDV